MSNCVHYQGVCDHLVCPRTEDKPTPVVHVQSLIDARNALSVVYNLGLALPGHVANHVANALHKADQAIDQALGQNNSPGVTPAKTILYEDCCPVRYANGHDVRCPNS